MSSEALNKPDQRASSDSLISADLIKSISEAVKNEIMQSMLS